MLWPTVCLYLTLAACGLLIGLVVLKYDLYLRNPWWCVALAVLLGSAGMWSAGQTQDALILYAGSRGLRVGDTFYALLAGSTEELAKFCSVVAVALCCRRSFNEPLDGLIIGSFAGLGAALEESVWVLGITPDPQFLPPQEPVRLAGHLIFGGIGGFGLGAFACGIRGGRLLTPLMLLVAALLHTCWDLVAFAAADYYARHAALLLWHTIAPVALMLLGMFAYKRLVLTGARWTRAYLNVCDLASRKCPPY